VREEIHHIREGKHGARSTKQAIAIGSARRGARREAEGAGRGARPRPSASAASATRAGRHPHKPSRTRSRATTRA
jgi:hypothetical protein